VAGRISEIKGIGKLGSPLILLANDRRAVFWWRWVRSVRLCLEFRSLLILLAFLSTRAVQTAFLNQSVEWTKGELREQANFRVASTLFDAIVYALDAATTALPSELVLKLLTELRENHAIRFAYPFHRFLSVLSRDQVTDEIRAELRRLQFHYAPTATGKIDERTQKTRNLLTELMHVEGEEALDPGRGPWSRIVFEEISAYEEITSSGWKGLLDHCRALEQAVPASKWRKRGRDLAQALGESAVWTTLQRWLALGPTRGQPAEACSPIEDSSYQKGVVWLLSLSQRPEAASTLAESSSGSLLAASKPDPRSTWSDHDISTLIRHSLSS
jgi:hypothetical protein